MNFIRYSRFGRFIVVLPPFPYVQFSQFKVCNNKCELKVGKWARMNNSDENGNFLAVSLRKFWHLSTEVLHKYLIQISRQNSYKYLIQKRHQRCM